MLATWHFHIEISSKCTLRCPRCARQEVPDNLVNTELDLEFFKRNFTAEFVLDNVEKITFCGDDGDPIYAHDLVPVIQYIKSHQTCRDCYCYQWFTQETRMVAGTRPCAH
jgi:MoaA/NifB/PqqE/SkfB family radical SAM enzyme